MKNLRDLRNQDIPRTYDENDLDAMMLSTPRIYSVFSRFHSILWIVAILAPLCNGTTYYYTGSYQTYTVPPGITKVSVELFGAKGGLGGTAILISTSLSVKSGQRYYVYVGGNGDINGLGGWNGGGNGTGSGTGGGGASDIRTRVDDLSSRIVVAAGSAGGASRSYSGGNGGCTNGYQGSPSGTTNPYGGFGGTSTNGGDGGYFSASYPTGGSGSLALGGNGASGLNSGGGGGG